MAQVIFFGNERLATGVTTELPVLKALLSSGYQVPAIVVAQGTVGSSRKERPLEILAFAEAHSIDLLYDLDAIGSYHADAGVLAAYGKLVPEAIIKSLPGGIVNLHPSLLPLHRGPVPIEATILAGDSQTGVSLMQLSATMDTGPVYIQASVELNGQETKQQLADELGSLGAKLLSENLSAILDGSLAATPQNDSLATYDKRLTKSDSWLDAQKPAEQLAREVRAYAGWPRSRLTIASLQLDITVTSARVLDVPSHGRAGDIFVTDRLLCLQTASGVLALDRLIPVGKAEMSATAFLAGYHL